MSSSEQPSQPRLPPLHVETPLLYSQPLSARLGRDVYVKMDVLQPSGSFKIRGIGQFMQKAVSGGVDEFVCSSGGNAGLAALFAASALGKPITIVTPESTPSYVPARMRALGATVYVEGKAWAQADVFARALVSAKNVERPDSTVYVPPFDHPDVWAGNGTVIEEVYRQLPHTARPAARFPAAASSSSASSSSSSSSITPAAVVVCVGGGGLLLGCCEAMARVGWDQVPIIATETVGAGSFAAMQRANDRIRLPAITTLAVTLGAAEVAPACLRWHRARPIHSVLVTDQEAVLGAAQAAIDHRVLVEPSCGSVYAALSRVPSDAAAAAAPPAPWNPPGATPTGLAPEDVFASLVPTTASVPLAPGPLVVIVCGGNMASPAILAQNLAKTGVWDAVQGLDVVTYPYGPHLPSFLSPIPATATGAASATAAAAVGANDDAAHSGKSNSKALMRWLLDKVAPSLLTAAGMAASYLVVQALFGGGGEDEVAPARQRSPRTPSTYNRMR